MPLGPFRPGRFDSIPPKKNQPKPPGLKSPMIHSTNCDRNNLLQRNLAPWRICRSVSSSGTRKQEQTSMNVGKEVTWVSVGTLVMPSPPAGVRTNLKRNYNLGNVMGKS